MLKLESYWSKSCQIFSDRESSELSILRKKLHFTLIGQNTMERNTNMDKLPHNKKLHGTCIIFRSNQEPNMSKQNIILRIEMKCEFELSCTSNTNAFSNCLWSKKWDLNGDFWT